jgi:1,4-dihydroxy-2-naphthoate octaprenyltransferase
MASNAPVPETAGAGTGGRSRFWAGFWRLADPKISLASLASMFLGACAAARAGRLAPQWLALTVFGVLAIEIGKNASGEIIDFDSGVDPDVAPEERSPFSGGKRVLVDGLLTKRQTGAISAGAYLIGCAIGLAITALRAPSVLWLGVAGVAMAFFYHASPLRLSYRGLGEAAVALCYGPMILAGTYLVQRGDVPREIVLLGVPLGLVIAAFLWVNEYPDYRTDRDHGKRTLVVRLGRRRAAGVFSAILSAAFGLLAIAPAISSLPPSIWAGFVGLPPAAFAAVRLVKHPEDVRRVIPAQAATLVSFVLLSLGAGLGLLVSVR